MTDLATSILALLAWPAGCVVIAAMVYGTPLWRRLDAFLFPGGGGERR